jgi:hypothetical protein
LTAVSSIFRNHFKKCIIPDPVAHIGRPTLEEPLARIANSRRSVGDGTKALPPFEIPEDHHFHVQEYMMNAKV